jgi:hypothetical protein
MTCPVDEVFFEQTADDEVWKHLPELLRQGIERFTYP